MRTQTQSLLAALPAARILDLRCVDHLRQGRSPFGDLIAAKGRLARGDVLRVRCVMAQPALCEEMARRGYDHLSESAPDGGHLLWFYRAAELEDFAARATHTSNGGASMETDSDEVVLDARELSLPAQAGRTLAALEELPAGGALIHLNRRLPVFLFPLLETRGYVYEVAERSAEGVRLRIRRRDWRCRLGTSRRSA